ncbi:MAG: bifunctional DNA primase/polymerase, partial [Pseudonocardiaceae bacterium]
GGRHLYFRHPGCAIPNDAGRRLGPGLDIRGDGGYVIAPPSRHESGGRYSVACHGGELPELPDWLLPLMRPRVAQRPSGPLATFPAAGGDPSAWARTALDGELRRLRGAGPGSRNDTLNRVAYRIGQIVGAGLLDEDPMTHALVDTAVSLGLSEHEAVGTARSGLKAGLRWPSGPASAWDPPSATAAASAEVDPPGMC